jgi:probable 2-oxoglutarate dehydrogenase E1 component DHKTD1
MHLPQSGDVPRSETGEGTDASRSLKEITEHLMGVYVDRIGYEFQQCPSKDERLWFQHHVETHPAQALGDARRRRVWELLSRSEEFDRFLGKKFPNLKRYGESREPSERRRGAGKERRGKSGGVGWREGGGGDEAGGGEEGRNKAEEGRATLTAGCEGAESMLPALDTLFELGAKANLQSIVVSLPHRGRLNLLTEPELFGYSATGLFSKIKGQPEFDPATAPGATGDVISHLGGIRELDYDGSKVKIEMLQNPSHLEVSCSRTLFSPPPSPPPLVPPSPPAPARSAAASDSTNTRPSTPSRSASPAPSR